MKREVFNYSRTYTDERLGRKATSISKFKAVREFIKQQEIEHPHESQYQILESTREFVEAEAIVGGKYHPELLRG